MDVVFRIFPEKHLFLTPKGFSLELFILLHFYTYYFLYFRYNPGQNRYKGIIL